MSCLKQELNISTDIKMQSNQENVKPNNVGYYDALWQVVRKDIIAYYGEEIYENWFTKVHFFNCENNRHITLAAGTDFVRDWVKSNYLNIVLKIWQHHDPKAKEMSIITKEGLTSIAIILPSKASISNSDNSSGRKDNGELKDRDDPLSFLDSRFTFENFVVGPPNNLAYCAAHAVADAPLAIRESNPLFLYGGVGLGKTHLMHAIAWHTVKKYPNRKVLYMSAEKFMYRFIQALRDKDVMSFKEEFRSVDVLMIDDIQFICGKESTQEEFFHTFNAIIDNNKQMVISCDRSPTDLDDIEERIKSRLGWGLVADVHSTTYELRLGIIQSKLEKMNAFLPKDVIDFLASKITSNVRELEGALNKVIAHSTLIGSEPNVENVQDILRDLLRSNERIITVEDIQKKIAARYNLKLSDMSSTRRLRTIARPRQIAMYVAKHLTDKSLADIGAKFGKKDHTTVLHAVKTIESLLNQDSEFREEVNLIMKILQN
jgi:chromosomal replication initiator protein